MRMPNRGLDLATWKRSDASHASFSDDWPTWSARPRRMCDLATGPMGVDSGACGV